ncbi:MAG: porin family protein [Marinobacter sp.]|nr:porin family protein [Marinobacter sp.]
MNMRPKMLALAAVAATLAMPVQADIYKSGVGGLYAGGNYTFFKLKPSGGSDLNLGTLSAKVGAMVTPFFGVEARAGVGVKDDSNVEITSFFGGYATLNFVNESPATPYAVLGFTRVEVESPTLTGTTKDDESDFSYGLGVNLALTREMSANLEYMRYVDPSDYKLDGISLGLTVFF